MSLTGVLLVVFVVLKLAGIVAWSWWLVMSPLLFVLVVSVIVGAGTPSPASPKWNNPWD